MRISSDIKEWR